jgi:uncharacterized protein (DUF427 family)
MTGPLTKARRAVLTGNLLYQPSNRWVCATVGNLPIVDSRHPVLVWESDRAIPHYAFPYDEVSTELLRPCRGIVPRHHVGAAEWFDLGIAGHTVPRVAWAYAFPELSSYIAFDRANQAMRQIVRWQERPLSANARDLSA